MSILEVLNNLVCRDQLFSFLETNDLLRLRRVSKTLKDDAEDFIRRKKVATKRLLQIHLCADDPFEQLNEFRDSVSSLPITTTAMIIFPGKATYVRKLWKLRQHFKNTYGTNITHLKLFGLTLPLYSASKFQLFDPFPNLTHLTIERVYPPPKNEIPSSTASADTQEIKIPMSFTKLKSLKVYIAVDSRSLTSGQLTFDFIEKLVETCCSTLEELHLPFVELAGLLVDMEQLMRLMCKCVFTCPSLKLWSVDGFCVDYLLKSDERPEMQTVDAVINSINDKIVAIHNPLEETFNLELPNLERITFSDFYYCMMPGTDEFVRQDWPKLKGIEVNLKGYLYDPDPIQVWNFLFGYGIRRENMDSLKIDFDGFYIKSFAAKELTLARTMDLITSCPNLKILYLKNEIKQLVDLHELWRRLPFLEDVRFDNCNDLADSDFIGDDPKNPLFWNLKKLKILKLEQINGIRLTNDLLSKVLCQMPLKDFTLSSDHQNPGQHSICLKGIIFLLTGKFASTIESLNICHLHIPHVSLEKRMTFEQRFRSWRMI